MTYWFTSDTHFGHANIIKYCNRPFSNATKMNEAMIEKWNARVARDDVIYHLGDFAYGGDDDFIKLIQRLSGNIVFVKGNHDKVAWKNRHKFAGSYNSYAEIKIGDQSITLCHYAMRVWNKSHHGSWHLYGHSHGSLPDDPHSLSFDVGVDCHEFAPISFEDVKRIMAKKIWYPIDHHGEKKDGGGVGLDREAYARLERKKKYLELKKEFGD